MNVIAEPLSVTIDGALARIHLGRPDEGNKLTRAMMFALARELRRLAGEADVRVIALVAQGPAFCLGRDGRGEPKGGLRPWDARQQQMGAVLAVYEAIEVSPVPIVACVQGDAIGFGAALAGACDVTLASSAARFALPEIDHSIPATLAMSALVRRVPQKALAHLIYSAESVSAETAVAIGLASKVLPAAAFEAEAEAYLAALAARPRLVLETIKRYLGKAQDLSPQMAAEYAGTLLALVRPSL